MVGLFPSGMNPLYTSPCQQTQASSISNYILYTVVSSNTAIHYV